MKRGWAPECRKRDRKWKLTWKKQWSFRECSWLSLLSFFSFIFFCSLLFSHPGWHFASSWTAAHQASLSLTISRRWPKFLSIASVMPSSHLILWHPLLLLPSIFPSSRDFSNKSVVCIRWPKYWSFIFSICPSNEYSGPISLRLTGLISLLSKGLSGVFSSTTVESHRFFGVLSSLRSSSHNHIQPLGRL